MPLAKARRTLAPTDIAERFFCPCPRGLEEALAQELAELGLHDAAVVPGGVGFSGRWQDCYRVNLWSRIASRVLWRVGQTRYRSEDDIFRATLALPWPRWFSVDDRIRVNVSAIQSPLRSLEFVTLRIKDAVCDRFREAEGARPSVDTAQPDVRIHAFLTDRDATFYLDTSGEALFKRGVRQTAGEAPLRENLAAGILRLTGWTPAEPLFDPMCGSGTFLIEGAQMALGIAPGAGRRFGFEKLRTFDGALWKRLRADAMARTPGAAPRIFGSDLDPAAIEATHRNLEAAGLQDVVQVQIADFTTLTPPCDPGVLVTNPPYGVRLGETGALQQEYPVWGDALKQRFSGWRAYLLSGDAELPKRIGLKASRRTPLFNGAIECRLYEYRMVAGTLRRVPKTGEGAPPETSAEA